MASSDASTMEREAMANPQDALKTYTPISTSLPFGRHLPLDSISGPTYLTTQTLVQQVAYLLSDRLWTYSPDTFDLDLAVKEWHSAKQHNVHGHPTGVEAMQIRQGAGSIALGYAFCKDFEFEKRHLPQSIVGSSASLVYLRSTLDQLSLLYSIASNFVAQIASVDYTGSSSRLVSDYVSAMSVADDLDLALVASNSTHEAQHMALYATLLAKYAPSIHIYDGVMVGRETTRVIDVLDKAGLARTAKLIADETAASEKKSEGLDSKATRLLKVFNAELGTQYEPFEYHGHEQPDHVLVAFGTVESSLAAQVASKATRKGFKLGVVNVRLYRPFLESCFIEALPASVQSIGVLGQVLDDVAVSDPAIRSQLYYDVFGSVAFSSKRREPPAIFDLKYPREVIWTPVSMAAAFQMLTGKPLLETTQSDSPTESPALHLLQENSVDQYSFWDFDSSSSFNAATVIAKALAIDSAHNITSKSTFDNHIQGGIMRSDIRRSKKTVEAAYSVDNANVAYIGDIAILKHLGVIRSIKAGGNVILNLPNVKDEDLEAKLPAQFRRTVGEKKINLYILDTQAVGSDKQDLRETFAVQCAFLRVALPTLEKTGLQRLANLNGSIELFEEIATELDKGFRLIEVPEAWTSVEIDEASRFQPADVKPNSFTLFEKEEVEAPAYLKDWKTVAQGLAFKEAFDTRSSVRPDLSIHTHVVTVQENRRLTPPTYNRNIFHIEFDLGKSGLKYDIGEALGIHPENDPDEVQQFMKFYGLDPDEVVEVPSRESAFVLENRTVYQSLMQNIDIFGRPPKLFYEALAEFATDDKEAKALKALGGAEGAVEFKRRAEVDTVTYADILLEFPSAHPSVHDVVRLVSPIKRREYSIASCQKVTPNSVALMVVVVDWVDPSGRDRFGMATRYLHRLAAGTRVTVSVKPSVMKLPPRSTQPLIMAGLGTGLAPFRAFVQHRALEKSQGKEIGAVLLYMGSRHQREEYCYGEEWEAYMDAGIITLMGKAFSRDQPQKIYIQDRMRQTLDEIAQAYLREEGAFYLCGPTWPVPDVTNVLEEAIAQDAKVQGKKVNPRKEIEKLKDEGRYVLEVY